MTGTVRKGKSRSSADPVEVRLEAIERRLIENSRTVMRVKDLARYFGKTEATVRAMLTETDMPRHYDGKGHVYFIRHELEWWLYHDNGMHDNPRMLKRGHIGYRWLTKAEAQYQTRIWRGGLRIGVKKTWQPVPI